jgi:glycosyltransferase involved in cell wall biosynthesis
LNKKKVAIITSFPRQQRVEVYNEMKRLNEVDFKVFYLRELPFGRHWKKQAEIHHDSMFIKEKRIKHHLYLSPGLFSAVDEYSPDLLIFSQYAAVGSQLMMYRCFLKRIPWVLWAERPYIKYAENPIVSNKFIRSLLRYIALIPVKFLSKEVWGVGETGQEQYKKIVGSRAIVRNLPLHLNLDEYFKINQSRKAAAKAHFIFSGALSERKGADVIAKVIRRLASEGQDFEISIAGKGPLLDDFIEVPEEVKKHIHYVGFLEFSELASFYARGNIVLVPSRHDGWANSLIEGMACGMPAISTCQTGSAVDLVRDEINGVLLPYLSEENLYEAMSSFIDNPNRIDKLGTEAHKTSEEYTHRIGATTFLNYMNNAFQNV